MPMVKIDMSNYGYWFARIFPFDDKLASSMWEERIRFAIIYFYSTRHFL